MCMDRSPVPAKKIWLAIASRLGLRPTAGLRKLRKEVRTCEYRDVHIMWEMLREMDSPVPLEEKEAAAAAAVAAAAGARKNKAAWSRFVYYCCAF
ncbi:hypothetical protein CFC21_067793 [Triticum aestivum]|uniref:Uncharacterized protein n=2 Tax=Triticum aestivum TaxID=4565 RepID=A0A9R1KNZ2_WHEAT|nr:uncharacterized protein LOC123107874 [Triticum aestivum]KAF7061061.1 hypothetical protein CFC21_067793 [Triticum aestivum]